MMTVTIIGIAAAFGFLIMTIWYTIEAMRESLMQGLLVLLIPYYCIHFAYVRSRKGLPHRMVLVACAVVSLLVASGRIVLLSQHAT